MGSNAVKQGLDLPRGPQRRRTKVVIAIKRAVPGIDPEPRASKDDRLATGQFSISTVGRRSGRRTGRVPRAWRSKALRELSIGSARSHA